MTTPPRSPTITGARRHQVLAALAIITALVIAASPAAIAEGESIKGTLETVDNTGREPVAGATVNVELEGGSVGSATSAADGTWEIPVPGPATYSVSLDTDTLPEGIGLADENRQTLPDVVVRSGQNKSVRFTLGPGRSANVGDWERFFDLVLLGVKLGAIIALSAIGLSLIFGVTGLVNFAHGELVTLGAVLAFFFHASGSGPGWALIIAGIPAVAIAAFLGGAQEVAIWRPLRARQTGAIAMLVISIGVSFAIRNLILVIFDGEPETYDDYAIQKEVSFLGISTVPKNLVIIVASAVILVAVGIFLQRTRAGVAMRAVSDNRDLAESSGIDVDRVILITWVMGAGLAALGGIFLGVSEQVQWDMGFRVLLLIFAAVVLGGLGTAFGAMIGGFVIGLSVEVSTFWIDTELKNAVALGVLVVMLLLRPQGLLGSKERVG